ncbi:MAG: DUF2341 domain-containing protein [Bdellovibrionales bacterium]|nr:DUF2341 domain-containing protein [Bdellovibrionales bacterium]
MLNNGHHIVDKHGAGRYFEENVIGLKRLPLTFFLFCFAVLTQFSQAQHMLFHLLGAGEPIANFSTTSQTFAESAGVWSDWSSNLSAWTKRRQVLVDGVGGALTDFPVMIKLDSTRIDYGQVQSAAQDLRFTNDAGTLLSYEIEKWDAAGTSVVWVKVPTLSAYPTKSSIWMYYGNASAIDAQSATTWDTSFAKVMHLNGTTGSIGSGAAVPSAVGVAGTANNGGSGMSYAAGQIANGVVLDGADDWINIGSDASLNFGANAPLTVSVFFKTTDTSGPLVNFRDLVTGSPIVGLYIGNNGASAQYGMVNVILRDDSGSTYAQIAGPTINDDLWHHLVLSRNAGSSISLYVDGVSYGTAAGASTGGAITTTQKAIGADRYWVTYGNNSVGERFFAGAVDQLEVSTTQRSADWIQATYLSARDELTTFRSEETPTSGAAIITVQLNTSATTTITIPYTVSGTAAAGTDHSRVSGNLVINGGSSSGSLNTYVLRDNLAEGSETAILTLGAPTGASLGPDTVHTVTITDEVLSPPDAVDDSINVTNFSAVTIPVLANDTDANGDTLTITSFTAPSAGTAVRVGQTIRYTPTQDFPATDSFTYTISDGRGGTDTATVTLNYQIPFTWIGSGADANWTTTANWLGGTVPGASNTAYFNNQCTTYCNPSINGNVSVAGLRMNTSFSGTIAQNNTNTITIGTSGWTQRAGTFTGGNSAITHNGPFVMNGGTFTSTSGTYMMSNDFTITAGTFNHGGGTLRFENASAVQTYYINVSSTIALQNLQVSGGQSGSNSAKIWNLQTGSFDVLGTFRMGRTTGGSTGSINLYTGTVYVKGNIVLDPANLGYGNQPAASGGGSATLVVNGTGAQTFASASGGSLPNLQLNKSSGTFGPADGTANSFMVNSLTLTAGSMTAPSGSLTVNQDFVQSAGTTFTHNGGTLVFDNYGEGSAGGSSSVTTSGTLSVNNLTIAGGRPGSATSWTWNLAAANFDVAANLSLMRTTGTGALNSNGGSITVAGSISTTTAFAGGTTAITATGTAAQSLSQAASTVIPGATLTANKASGTIAQTAATALSTAGQSLTVSSGVYNMAGFSLAVNSVLTVSSGAKLLCNGGTLTYGSASIAGEVSCGPSAGITWTGLAGDGLWSTAGNWTNNTIPGASDIAYFNGSCTNCNATVNSAISVKGIVMASSYTGTITQSNTMTLGASGWSVAGGAFVGGSSAITITGSFVQSGGTFTSTSATITTITGAWTVSGGTFNHGSGTVKINNGSSNYHQALTPGTANYNNVYIDGWGSTHALTGTWNVTGTLTVGEGYGGNLNGGTILATGNVNFVNKGYNGTTLIKLVGSTSQTVTSVSTAFSPAFEIDSTGGTVTFSGYVNMSNSYKYTAGTVDTGTSTIAFRRDDCSPTSVTPGAINYYNITFDGYCSFQTITGTLTVNGTLTFDDTYSAGGGISGGTIVANGPVTSLGFGKGGGTTLLKIGGSGNQTITGVSTSRFPIFEIASTGGVVTLAGTLRFAKNFTYTSGTIDGGTSTLAFYGYGGGATGTITSTAAATFNNLTFDGYGGNWTIAGTVAVGGTLSLADTSSGWGHSLTGGTILAYGNVTSSAEGMQGTTNIRVVGSVNQTVSGTTPGWMPSLEIASTGGTVTLAGTMYIARNYVYTAGTLDPSTSTLVTNGNGGTASFTPGPASYNNVILAADTVVYTVTGTLNVNGTLAFNSSSSSPPATYNGGAIVASGNVAFSSSGALGTTTLTFAGSTNTTLSAGAGAFLLDSSWIANKTVGAKVTMLNNVTLGRTGQDLTIAGGTLDLGGYTLSVVDTLTVNSGTTLKCSGGSFSNGILSNSGTINCPGYSTYEFNWTGAGGNSNWDTAANWAGGNVPGASDTPAFQDTYCGANCNATMNAAVNIRGLQMLSPYTGTITQASGSTVTVGLTGWTQAAGTFAGSDAAVTIGGVFLLSGGTFTAPSSTVSVDGTYTVSGAGTFTAGTSTVQFTGSGTRTITPGTGTYNNVTFPAQTLCYGYALGGATLKVGGLLTVNARNHCGPVPLLDNGTVEAYGDVVVGTHGLNGTASIVLKGNVAGQTVTGVTGASIPNLQIAAGANNVTLSGTIDVFGNYIVTSVGTLTLTGTTLRFVGTGAATITPGTHMYNNVSIPFLNACNSWNLGGGTLNVGGALVVAGSSWCSGIARALDNGTVKAYGSVDLSQAFQGGTGVILVAGNSGGQTVTGGATSQVSKLNFDTGSYAATLSGAVKATTSSNVATGSVALANSSSSFNTLALTLNGRTFTKNGGALTVNSVLAGTGSLFGGTVAP